MTKTVKRIEAARERELWAKYVAGGRIDDELRNRLISRALPAAKHVARKMHYALCGQVSLADLEQEAAMGLLQSAEKYDPRQKASFKTFSYRRMLGGMIDAARGNDELSRHHRQLVKQREDFEEEHLHRHGSRPASHVVCDALGWSERRYMQSCAKKATSLQAPGYENGETSATVMDLLAGAVEDPGGTIQVEFLARRVLGGMGLQDQFIVWAHLFVGKTQCEVAEFIGVSESRVSQRLKELRVGLLKRISEDEFLG